MNEIKLWGWDKKPRTMLRYIKSGDIFCFKESNELYRFGRIIAKIATGHVAEILDYTLSNPAADEKSIVNASRAIPPLVLDSYGLFDRKDESESDWRIIGHQDNYAPEDAHDIFFTYGLDPFF